MRIAVFIAGMILAMAIVGMVSVMSGAGFWVTVLRVVGTAFVAQVLYVGAILLMARSGARKDRLSQEAALPFSRREKTEAR